MTLTQGTALWAIQQMLEGKKICQPVWDKEEYVHIKDGRLYAEDDEQLDFELFGVNDKSWLLWSPPNPHTKGTFPWAWEEIQRGNKVKVYEPNFDGTITMYYWKAGEDMWAQQDCNGKESWITHFMHTILINSTNWELA